MSQKPIIALRVNPELKNYISQMSNDTGRTMSGIIKDALLNTYEITYEPEKYTFNLENKEKI